MTPIHSSVTFHDGRLAPQLGLGVWRVEDEDAARVVRTAIDVGYRAIDTAAIYGNEAGVGQGLRDAGIARQDVFVTTKVWNDRHGHRATKEALQESLDRLQLDYVDLYLIHWPVPSQDRYVKAWEALMSLRDEGRVKSIGVCNFQVEHLQRLLDATGALPVVNQIELHPRFQQAELRAFHQLHDIVTEAWSPLGQASVLDDPVLQSIAHKHGCSAAQAVLRWHLQLGHKVIPKTVHADRMRENLYSAGFQLDADDLARIAGLDREDGRLGPDPDHFGA